MTLSRQVKVGVELHGQRSLYRLDQGQQVGENHFHDFYIRVGLHIANSEEFGRQWELENAMGLELEGKCNGMGGWIGFSVNRI